MVELEKKSLDHLEQLLKKTQESFDGLSARWSGLQPRSEFDVKISEDFHLGFVFGKSLCDGISSAFGKVAAINMGLGSQKCRLVPNLLDIIGQNDLLNEPPSENSANCDSGNRGSVSQGQIRQQWHP